jgi:hypothetical protein
VKGVIMQKLSIAAGVHEADQPEGTMGRFPGAGWGREFVAKKGGGALPTSTTTAQLISMVMAKVQPWLRAGGGCVVSLKLHPTQMSKGVWDERLVALGRALASLNVIVILWHEPEDDFAAAQFAPGFAAGRAALRQGWSGLCVALCAMAYQWRPGGRAAKEAAAWAAIEADLYLVDVYSGNNFPADAILPHHPGFIRWHKEMVAAFPGRRWGVAERGWQAGPKRAQTIAREGDWLVTDPVGRTCELYLVWGTGGTEGDPGWELDGADELAVRALLARVTIPAGYLPGPVDGTFIHKATGVLVAAEHTRDYDAHLTNR